MRMAAKQAVIFKHPSFLLPASIVRATPDGSRVAVVRDELLQLVDVRRNTISGIRLSSAVVDAVWVSVVSVAVGCADGSVSILNSLDRSHQSTQKSLRPVIQLRLLGSSLFVLHAGFDLYEMLLADIKQTRRHFKLGDLTADPLAFALVKSSHRLVLTTFGGGVEFAVQFEIFDPMSREYGSLSTSLMTRIFGSKSGLAETLVSLHAVQTLSDPGRVCRSLEVAGERAYVCDSLGRVTEMDLVLGATITRIWKGYRQAEVAVVGNSLLIYQPHRDGVCEVWSLLEGTRVAALPVSSGARLLLNGWFLSGDSLVSAEFPKAKPTAEATEELEEQRRPSSVPSPSTSEELSEAALRGLADASLLRYHLRRNRALTRLEERVQLAEIVVGILADRDHDGRMYRELKLLKAYTRLLIPFSVETDLKRLSWGETPFGAKLLQAYIAVSGYEAANSISEYVFWLQDALGDSGLLDGIRSCPDLFTAPKIQSASYEAFCQGEALTVIFSKLLGASAIPEAVAQAIDLAFVDRNATGVALVKYLLSLPLKTLLAEQAPLNGLGNPAVIQALNVYHGSEILAELVEACPATHIPHMALLCAFAGMKAEVDRLLSSLNIFDEDRVPELLVWSVDTEELVEEISADVVLQPTIHLFLATRTLSQDLKIYRIQQAIRSLNQLEDKKPDQGAVAYFIYKMFFEGKLRQAIDVTDLADTAVSLTKVALKAKTAGESTQGGGNLRRLLIDWFFSSTHPNEVKLSYVQSLVVKVAPVLLREFPPPIQFNSVPGLVKRISTHSPFTALEVAEIFELRQLLEKDLLYGLISAFEDWRLDEPGWAKKALQQVAVKCLEERLAFVAQLLGDDVAGSGGVLFAAMRPDELEKLVALDLNQGFVDRCSKMRISDVLRSIILAGSAPHVSAVAEIRDLVSKARKMLDSLPDAI